MDVLRSGDITRAVYGETRHRQIKNINYREGAGTGATAGTEATSVSGEQKQTNERNEHLVIISSHE